MEGKRVWTNSKMETSVKNVFAIGDLVSPKMFAHVAYEQGVIAAENALGKNFEYDYSVIPYGIYTNPEIAGVGLTESEARSLFGNVKVGKFSFAALGICQATGEIEGFVKIIADHDGKVLGLHIIGPSANALVGLGVLALKNKLTLERLADSFQAHPSYPEAFHEAALSAIGLGLHSL